MTSSRSVLAEALFATGHRPDPVDDLAIERRAWPVIDGDELTDLSATAT